MFRSWLALFAILAVTTALQAKVELKNVQACYGILGPERKSLEVFPNDELIFRFVAVGVRTDANGRIDAIMSWKLTNDNGDVLGYQDNVPLVGHLSLGGDTFPAHFRFNVGDKLPAGDYQLTISFTDKLSTEKASFQRKIVAKPSEFALVAPDFSVDAEGKIPAQAGGLLGQVIHFRARAIGLDRTQEKISAVMTLQILDAQGKDVLAKPVTADFKNDDAEVVRKVAVVTFRHQLLLNRIGNFTMRVTIMDKIANKSTKYETPLTVTAP